jgi:hypothetical protein
VAIIPKSIKVGPFNISVIERDLEEAMAFGMFYATKQQISLHKNIDIQVKREALFHEFLHVVWFMSGLDGRELGEDYIKSISPIILDAMRENPELMEFLLDGH